MTVKGIEVGGTIYDNEDETARSTATEAASTARTASQTATTASETATTASQTATQASEKASENASAITELQGDIEDIQAVIPSTATSSNKLTTEQDLSGLCNIVTTQHPVSQGFQINNSSSSSPGCYWSINLIPVLPEPNAVLINVFFDGTTWYPNAQPFVRGGRVFNLISPENYTIPQDINYTCVWAIPKS